MLVDTSVWVDHFRHGNPRLVKHLTDGLVWCHEFVIGELACGNLRRRSQILNYLSNLPRAVTATHEEVLQMVDTNRLHGTGLGWVEVHLLAAALIAGQPLWTLDQTLGSTAQRMGVGIN